jgi:hypothetical protein
MLQEGCTCDRYSGCDLHDEGNVLKVIVLQKSCVGWTCAAATPE